MKINNKLIDIDYIKEETNQVVNEYNNSQVNAYSSKYVNNLFESGFIKGNQMSTYTLDGNTYTYYVLNFENTYTTPPNVIVSIRANSKTGNGIERCMATNITNTSCEICLSARVNSAGYGVSYMVISND